MRRSTHLIPIVPNCAVLSMIANKLNANVVDLWLDDLSCHSLQQLLYEIPLSDEEQQRAAAFYFAEHRRHYVLAHQYLRWVLSQYLALSPEKIRFATNTYGKPELVEFQNVLQLQFNLSHSDCFIAVGVGKTHALGVDIETIKTNKDITTLAEHCFSLPEWQHFSSIVTAQQQAEFYRHWARKEAYIKALGTGLHTSTASFSIDLEPADNPTPVIDTNSREAKWKIWSIEPTGLKNCACAVATQDSITSIFLQPQHHADSFFSTDTAAYLV